MKKRYITPAVSVVELSLQIMIAASGDNVSFPVSDDEKTGGYSDVKERSYNVWQDDWTND